MTTRRRELLYQRVDLERTVTLYRKDGVYYLELHTPALNMTTQVMLADPLVTPTPVQQAKP